MPQNGIYLTYVPHVPQLGHKWGTQYTRAQDGQYFEKIEKFDTPIFLVGLIYRWGKGAKTKNDQNDQKLMKIINIISKKIN